MTVYWRYADACLRRPAGRVAAFGRSAERSLARLMDRLDRVRRADEPEIDGRIAPRRRVADAWPRFEAQLDGARFDVVDLSEEGFRLRIDGRLPPERAVAEVLRADEPRAMGTAVRVWTNGREAGYRYLSSLAPGAASAAASARVRREAGAPVGETVATAAADGLRRRLHL